VFSKAYIILLIIPVTVAYIILSKLKLLKSYLHIIVVKERLNGLATIAIENHVLEKTKYGNIIEDFISKNSRRMMLFSG
jgi:ferric iron reductase protein FhuF